MKKNLKVALMSGIASMLAATIIFVSGGSTIIVALLGGAGILTIPGFIHLNDIEQNKGNTSHVEPMDFIQQIPEVINSNKELELQNVQIKVLKSEETETKSTQSIAPIKQYDEDLFIQKLITTDALSQQEDILVRRRKKQTEEKLPENNNY